MHNRLSRAAICGIAVLGIAGSLASAGVAHADRPERARPGTVGLGPHQGATGYIEAPASSFTYVSAAEPISKIIFLNRCKDGCTITGGTQNDARTNSSTVPANPVSMIAAFDKRVGNLTTDETWQLVVDCVRDVYSPFDVEITDVDPGASVLHHEAIVAGVPSDIGLPNNILGVVAGGGCTPTNNQVSFTFANQHSSFEFVDEVCSTVAQESAHAFALDHALDCSDPMTYLPYCGRKFFRNKNFECGEDVARDCNCGGLQNAHALLTTAFGAGTPTTPPPVTNLVNPQNGASVTDNFSITATASDERGIAHVDYYLNGYKWGSKPGVAFGPQGQPSAAYAFSVPNNLPDGKIDIVVKAFNDLEIETSTSTITVQKGADCANADSCLAGQKCEAGKCFWDPPVGEIGDDCTYAQFCKTERCESDGEDRLCTESCFAGVDGSCPDGFSCLITGGAMGVCWPEGDGGGCCSTGGGDGDGGTAPFAYGGLSGLVLMVMLRKRRK